MKKKINSDLLWTLANLYCAIFGGLVLFIGMPVYWIFGESDYTHILGTVIIILPGIIMWSIYQKVKHNVKNHEEEEMKKK